MAPLQASILRRRWFSRHPPWWARYGMAVLTPVIAIGLYDLFDPLMEPATYLFLTPAVVFSAWFGGIGPGIVASVLSVAIADYLYSFPSGDFALLYTSDAIEIVVFLAVALLVSSTMESLRSAWSAAEAANDETTRAVESRDEVLAVVSHDLRDVVGAAVTSTRAVLDLDLVTSEKGRRLLKAAVRALEEGDRMINDLLDVGQAESGILELHPRAIPPSDLIRESVSAFEESARRSEIELSAEAGEDLPLAHVDPDRLSRVLFNLIGNALKFTPPGGRVQVGVRLSGDGELVFSVSDTGPGIRAEDREKLFEPFWKGAGEGVGLGLSIAEKLVKAHGGRMSVESQPGQGATFLFTVPRVDESTHLRD